MQHENREPVLYGRAINEIPGKNFTLNMLSILYPPGI